MMKSLLLATAAVATFAAAPALAQDAAGSIGVQYSEADFGAPSNLETWSLDGVAAMPAFGDWTVTLAADVDNTEFFGDDETSASGSAGLSKMFGADTRFGGFVAAADVGDETAWTGGFGVQKYLSKATLTGGVAYTDVYDADVWTVSGDAAFYVMPNLRLNAGLAYQSIDEADIDAWTYGVGAEYDIGSTPFAVTAGFAKTDFDGGDIDTWSLGLRYTFGGDQQSRDRAGTAVNGLGIGSLISIL
ncbi:MAG: hypothetical protein V4707_09760 [Pseudomonadota bacterium]